MVFSCKNTSNVLKVYTPCTSSNICSTTIYAVRYTVGVGLYMHTVHHCVTVLLCVEMIRTIFCELTHMEILDCAPQPSMAHVQTCTLTHAVHCIRTQANNKRCSATFFETTSETAASHFEIIVACEYVDIYLTSVQILVAKAEFRRIVINHKEGVIIIIANFLLEHPVAPSRALQNCSMCLKRKFNIFYDYHCSLSYAFIIIGGIYHDDSLTLWCTAHVWVIPTRYMVTCDN